MLNNQFKKLQHINDLINSQINEKQISGASIRVVYKNETIYDEIFGLADIKNNKEIKKDTIFRLYSMTKPVTAVAVMILFERGLISLLDPVSKFLPGFYKQKVLVNNELVDSKREVTIKDLLNMTSGLVYPDENFMAGKKMIPLFQEIESLAHSEKPLTTVEIANKIGQLPLEFQPGQGWRYSSSADVLGAIVEVVSKKRYSKFLSDEIFSVLAMEDTGFYVAKEKYNRFAKTYDYNYDKNDLVEFEGNFLGLCGYKIPPAFESGGAGLVSTVDDYSKFALMLLNDGSYNGHKILSKKTIDYLSTPSLNKKQLVNYNWDSTKGYNYANLMRILVDTSKAASNGSLGEFGWDGWTGNYFLVDRQEKLMMIYMIQRCGGIDSNTLRRLRQILYSAI